MSGVKVLDTVATYGREGESLLLNFQNRAGLIKSYQARQLAEMVEKYGRNQDPSD